MAEELEVSRDLIETWWKSQLSETERSTVLSGVSSDGSLSDEAAILVERLILVYGGDPGSEQSSGAYVPRSVREFLDEQR
jgi:hypothetical protein